MKHNELRSLVEYLVQEDMDYEFEMEGNAHMVSLQDVCPAFDIDFNDPFEVAQLGPGMRSDTVKPLRF